MKKILLFLIKAYQKSWFFRSPFLKALFLTDAGCRFQPSCSVYTYQAIEKYGTIQGMVLGIKRIVRCNPWNQGGRDPLK